MEKTGSRTVTTITSVTFTAEEVAGILKAHTSMYKGEVRYESSSYGDFTEAIITETHTEVVSTP